MKTNNLLHILTHEITLMYTLCVCIFIIIYKYCLLSTNTNCYQFVNIYFDSIHLILIYFSLFSFFFSFSLSLPRCHRFFTDLPFIFCQQLVEIYCCLSFTYALRTQRLYLPYISIEKSNFPIEKN